jgi:DNA-binding HxlR family transcriptional regulator
MVRVIPPDQVAACRWREVVDLIGDKWTVLILKALCHKQLRYSELHRAIPGISQKVLTSSLRQLERDGIVKRTVHPVIPPKVEYEMTSLGYSVFEVVDALRDWAESHLSNIEAAREQYDSLQLPKQPAAATISSV